MGVTVLKAHVKYTEKIEVKTKKGVHTRTVKKTKVISLLSRRAGLSRIKVGKKGVRVNYKSRTQKNLLGSHPWTTKKWTRGVIANAVRNQKG